MTLLLLNRAPEPSETDIPLDDHIFLEVVDTGGFDIDLSATQVFITAGTDPEELAFDAGTFQTGWDGAASVYAAPAVGILQITIDPTSDWSSEELVTVRVESENTNGDTFSGSYSFTAEDVTQPGVSSAEGRALRTVRVTFTEGMDASSIAAADFTIERVTGPSVDVVAVSAAVLSATTVDLTTDIDMSPAKLYRVVVSGVSDDSGNAIDPAAASAEFRAFEPPFPDARDFSLWRMFPAINRRQDTTEDFAKLVACYQEVIDLMLWDIDRWVADLLDPDTAQEQFLDCMLADMGNPFLFVASLDVIDKRRLVRVLVDIYKLKGTCQGIRDVVRFFLGIEVDCDEYNDTAETWVLGESELFEDPATDGDGDTILAPSSTFLLYSFVVTSAVVLTDTQHDLITRIVRYMKPAHTHFLGFDEPTAPATVDHVELGLSELGTSFDLH